MKFKVLLSLFITILLSNKSLIAQGFDKARLQGNWYLLERPWYQKMRISNDTIERWRLSPEMAPKGKVFPSSHIEKVVEKNKNIYVLSKNLDSLGKIKVTTILSFMDDDMLIAVNGIARPFLTVEKAESILEKDKIDKLGQVWYNEEQMNSFKKLKPISGMKKNEFFDFVKDYYPERKKELNKAEQAFGSRGVTVMENQIFNEVLIKKGYNPIVPFSEFEKVVEKYKDEKEIKPFLDKYLTPVAAASDSTEAVKKEE